MSSKRKVNVLSLFDGCSCGQIALNKANIDYENYFASEIDKYAINVTQSNFPNTKQLGDITKIDPFCLPKIDLLIGGSPCQGFSFAGKKLNFEDPRSKLFFDYLRILKALKAKNPSIKFLLENVKMKKEFISVINDFLEVEPVEINSAVVSAQNRRRLYWANFQINPIIGDGFVLRDVLDFTSNHRYLLEHEINRAIKSHSAKTYHTGKRMGAVSFPNNLDKKSKTLTVVQVVGNRAVNHVSDEKGIRILSTLEFERLQTIPEGYTAFAPENQRRKMIGNGWTVDVISNILKQINFDRE